MKRRTLDVAFSIGGVVFSLLLLLVGLILNNQKSFAQDYVRTELSAQKISFTPAKFLSDEEKKAECLVRYGTTGGDATKGQTLDSGRKAECYASSYIALHMREAASGAGYEGATYATMGNYVRPGTDVSLVDALDAAAAGPGVRRVVVQPHLLFRGHVEEQVAAAVARARERHPAVEWLVAARLGAEPEVAEALVARIAEALA